MMKFLVSVIAEPLTHESFWTETRHASNFWIMAGCIATTAAVIVALYLARRQRRDAQARAETILPTLHRESVVARDTAIEALLLARATRRELAGKDIKPREHVDEIIENNKTKQTIRQGTIQVLKDKTDLKLTEHRATRPMFFEFSPGNAKAMLEAYARASAALSGLEDVASWTNANFDVQRLHDAIANLEKIIPALSKLASTSHKIGVSFDPKAEQLRDFTETNRALKAYEESHKARHPKVRPSDHDAANGASVQGYD